MFSDDELKGMGIDADRCRAKVALYKSMAGRDDEGGLGLDAGLGLAGSPLSHRDKVLSASIRDVQIGYLYQVSAECSLILEKANGRATALLAGNAFLKAGLPYGLCVLTAFDGSAEHSDYDWETENSSFISPPGRSSPSSEDVLDRFDPRMEAMERPEQMVWLFLAAANQRRGREMLEETWGRFQKDMEDHGHLPVGPLGIPVSAHFHLFDAIRKGRGGSSALIEVFNIAMARRSEALTLAKRNTYLWKRVRSPVSLFDLHIFAVANAAAMHGILNQNNFADMYRSLDQSNPLLKLIIAPIEMALDQNPDADFQVY